MTMSLKYAVQKISDTHYVLPKVGRICPSRIDRYRARVAARRLPPVRVRLGERAAAIVDELAADR